MPTPDNHYDVIIIGSGPGGGSMAHRLASTGKRILILERGGYLPREIDNWSSKAVFVDAKYQAKETWHGRDGTTFHPGIHYYVGGNSKVYGAALFRLRERDFDEVVHIGGVSPAWPLKYDVFEPYYLQAEKLFHVHGKRGEDPHEPPSTEEYPFSAVSHEPKIQLLSEDLVKQGLRPFHLPLGILLDEKDGKATPSSICIRCSAFDGFPCLLNGKADAQVVCIEPTLRHHANVTLLTGAYVSRLETDPAGARITSVKVTRDGLEESYSADIVVVACGALSSALLLLRSKSDKHPNGLANRSDQVGRNYMRHNQLILMALLKEKNPTVFQKTLAVSDFYFESQASEYPLGLIQMCATTHGEQIKGEVVPPWADWLPETPFEAMADHALDFWLSSEDLPVPENRIQYEGEKVILDLHPTNMEALHRLKRELEKMMAKIGASPFLMSRDLYFGQDVPIGGTSHQAGTCRFGTDPDASVLDLDCKAHEIDNLYVTDASFFPSIGAVNPTLTIVANALRVGDIIRKRLGASPGTSPQPVTARSPELERV